MSVTYPDLTGSVFPDFIDELMNFMDVDIEELPYANQYYTFIKAGDLASAQTVLASRPRLKKMLISAENLNAIDQRLVAIERYVTMNQKQILFDATQPTIQVVGDIWAKIIATSTLRVEVEFYEKTATGYLPIKLKANMIEFADGQDAETKLGGIDGISDSLVSTNSRISASSKTANSLYKIVNPSEYIHQIGAAYITLPEDIPQFDVVISCPVSNTVLKVPFHIADYMIAQLSATIFSFNGGYSNSTEALHVRITCHRATNGGAIMVKLGNCIYNGTEYASTSDIVIYCAQ